MITEKEKKKAAKAAKQAAADAEKAEKERQEQAKIAAEQQEKRTQAASQSDPIQKVRVLLNNPPFKSTDEGVKVSSNQSCCFCQRYLTNVCLESNVP